MRHIEVRGSAPVREEIIEPVEIVIKGSFPDKDIKRIEDVGRGFEEDARKLFDALVGTLPQGTFIRLLGLMLNREAQNCYLIVSGKPEKPYIIAELIAACEAAIEWYFSSDGDVLGRGDDNTMRVAAQLRDAVKAAKGRMA